MSKLDLKQFEQTVIVRPLQLTDYEDVVALQRVCFPGMDTWTHEQFASQLTVFPEGQIGVEYSGRTGTSSSSSLVLDFELYKNYHSYDEITDNGFIRNYKPRRQDALRHRDHGRSGVPPVSNSPAASTTPASSLRPGELNLMRIVVGGRIPGYAARPLQYDAAAVHRQSAQQGPLRPHPHDPARQRLRDQAAHSQLPQH